MKTPDKETIGETVDYWNAWAPYFEDMERAHMVPSILERYRSGLKEPVLVVGGGLGLLVDYLRKQGIRAEGIEWSPAAIKLAKEKRDIELQKGDARNLPVGDEKYSSTIIATGVADFMSDAEFSDAVLESLRVTSTGGRIIVGCYQLSPAMERFARDLGFLRDGILDRRAMVRMSAMSSREIFKKIQDACRGSFLRAIGSVFNVSFRTYSEERRMRKILQKIFRAAPNTDALIETIGEKIPYRSEERVQQLLMAVGIGDVAMHHHQTCVIAEFVKPRSA